MIPGNGITILRHLNEVMIQIQTLANTDCRDRADTLKRCEDELLGISIDIASVCTDGAGWREIRQMVTEAGIEISEDLDRDLSQIHSGDDSCLK